jgi:hypothetical protein
MFSKGDPSSNLKRLQVTLKTRSGEIEQGAILIPMHHTLRQALNDEGPFIEFERTDGRRAFLLKTEIARIDSQISSEPQPEETSVHEWSRFDGDDARLVLGVGAEVTREELHDVWVGLVRPIIQIASPRWAYLRRSCATRTVY